MKEIIRVENEVRINENIILEKGDRIKILQEDFILQVTEIIEKEKGFFNLRTPLERAFGKSNVKFYGYQTIIVSKRGHPDVFITSSSNVASNGEEISFQNGDLLVGYKDDTKRKVNEEKPKTKYDMPTLIDTLVNSMNYYGTSVEFVNELTDTTSFSRDFLERVFNAYRKENVIDVLYWDEPEWIPWLKKLGLRV